MNRLSILLTLCLLSAACSKEAATYNLIPYPSSLTPKAGTFNTAGAEFWCDPAMDDTSKAYVAEFAAQFAFISNRDVSFSGEPSSGFIFRSDRSLPAENYILDISRDSASIRASSLRGFVYAVQTIKQLVPALIDSLPHSDANLNMPCVRIEDSPRFEYRGLMLDVARHFFDTDEVKKILDLMTLHKMNTLHWHLTDDQGWRIEIKKYPLLTEYGSIRKQTMIRKEWGHFDGTPYGGYYTQDEIRDVVAYAAARGITIIPEIDLPGHMQAALACFPELGCTGGPYEVWGEWGVSDDVLCPGKEKTFEFIRNVLTEIMDLFPSEYIHIGGDECPKVRWKKCPYCQARIKALGLKDDDKHSAEHYLQSYVTARVEKFINEHGRKIIGWDEIIEGKLAPNATVMSWRDSESGIMAASMGHDAIMTPISHFYLNFYQAAETDKEPLAHGSYIPIEKVYSYEPYTDGMSHDTKAHIIGIQANLWTEYISDNELLEYMLLPRMAAVSEVQWCQLGVRDWQRFVSGLDIFTANYSNMGCNFATTIFGVNGSAKVNTAKRCVEMTLSTAGDAVIYYTTDGSDPDTDKYAWNSQPIEIHSGMTLKAAAYREKAGFSSVFEQTFADSKALGHNAWFNTQPTPKYTYGGATTLTDGIESFMSYSNGAWIGWLKEPLDVTIDMGGDVAYSSVRLSTLIQRGDWIFPPSRITVSLSGDNENFTEAGLLVVADAEEPGLDELKSYTIEFPKTNARYLRVKAETVNPIPEWHGARGNAGHLFADEIVVN